jgi:hypothetical protein
VPATTNLIGRVLAYVARLSLFETLPYSIRCEGLLNASEEQEVHTANHFLCRFLLCCLFTTAIRPCSATSLRILLFNTPKGADSIEVATSGLGFIAPMLAAAIPDSKGSAELTIELPDSQRFFVRAIALGSSRTGRVFPFILAAASANVGETGTISLDFAAQPLSMTIGQLRDSGDGTVIVPVRFSGGGEFFKEGQVVDLWAGALTGGRPATGDLYFAPLIKGINATILCAFFRVPSTLARSPLQPGYHALDFQRGSQIPLLIGGPGEASSSRDSTTSPSSFSEDVRLKPMVPEPPPRKYTIVPDANGRLVRILQ